ncbi:hypothetical protein EF834_08740 [Rhodococcus spongiicola]|uniref:Uncharacterized protein n=2 Tax=Rhodococcus spongiicola TaxID=2487352 RepID=A0A438AWZ8_9NOCA|nr:hypothetical protein EF834_08740 [Rhodococcus spongiicola]
MHESVAFHMGDMGFESVSTRAGWTDDLFHVDGRRVVGLGTITRSPVDEQHLTGIHQTFYLGKTNDRWVHFSYGGYTSEARSFANRMGIALFEFDGDGRIVALSRLARSFYRRKPTERWKVRAVQEVARFAALSLIMGVVLTFPVVGWTLLALAALLVAGKVYSRVAGTSAPSDRAQRA